MSIRVAEPATDMKSATKIVVGSQQAARVQGRELNAHIFVVPGKCPLELLSATAAVLLRLLGGRSMSLSASWSWLAKLRFTRRR